MGFKKRSASKSAARTAYYEEYGDNTPMSLTEENVKVVFSRCLADKNSSLDDILPITLLYNEYGFINEDSPIKFSKKAIEKDTSNILLLFGQLRDVHEEEGAEEFSACRGNFSKASVRYDKVQWTVDATIIMKLFYLAKATGKFFIFNLSKSNKDGKPLTCGYTDGKTFMDKDMYKIALKSNRPYYEGFELKLCYKDDTKAGDAVWVSSESDGKIYYVCIGAIKPTLSPADPNFEAWWAEHKNEWIDPGIPTFEEWWAEHKAEWEK